LEQQGYQLYHAADGDAAIRLIEGLTIPPDLLISDLMLPKIGGRELARRVRQSLPALPILFISGYSPDAANQPGDVGSDEILLQKPFTPSALAGRVADMLGAP
jgi:CheY-like chemotaxis protein